VRMPNIGRILKVVTSSALLFACASDPQDGVTAQGHMPVNVPSTGLDAGPPDTGVVVAPPLTDGGAPTYTVVVLDGSGEGFEDGGCGASAIEAKQVVVKEEVVVEERIDEVQPVALYIVLDQSQSMEMAGLWRPAKEALKAFVTDPGSAGIDVALEFFPADGYDIFNVEHCGGTGLDEPAVAMGRLPAHAPNMTQWLDTRAATGFGTPIEAALRGAATFCQRFEQTSMGEECVVVLVTDGAPLGCEPDYNLLGQIAQMSYASGMGTRIFTVGLSGADFVLLDGIAKAGGAVDCDANSERFACDVSAGPNLLSAALQKIRSVVTTVKTHVETKTRIQETPVECEWVIPAPPMGQAFDRDRVNVQLSAPGLATPVRFGQVEDANACAEKGWHYDNASAPTRLIACPQTCGLLAATPQARVDVLLGCATIPLQ
jgi:hypothetical protein